MKLNEAMELLSQCSLGALLIDRGSVILSANGMAKALLHSQGKLEGLRLRDIAPPLCVESETPEYANTAFGEYLLRCPTLAVSNLPDGAQLVVFRDATNDACRDMLLHIVNQIDEGIVLCDAECRIWMLNDAATKMDSIVTQDVRGKPLANVYSMRDGTDMAIPRVIRDKRPLLGLRQPYTTCYGKHIDVVSNTYPILRNGQVLGGFNLLKDWSEIDQLHKKIIDLQGKLLDKRASGRQDGKSMLAARYTFEDIISISPTMNSVVAQCRQVAKTDSSVMIYGETGTGKELFAQSIHNASPRSDGPFLAINCAAIPENLLESLLFGTEKGAYTGAERRAGLFEQANGGTLLLDEINSMNINLQSKLLRVLQDGVIRRVGGMNEIQVDVRVLSNINMPPYEAIETGRLRRDLFYRLGVVNINVPPLRERKEDIPILAKRFIMACNEKLLRSVHDIDSAVQELFRQYDWPGNVRELEHAIEHAMNVLPDEADTITPAYLPPHLLPQGDKPMQPGARAENSTFTHAVRDFGRSAICRTLEETRGNVTAAARMLGMSRQNLQYYIKRYHIDCRTPADKPPQP